MLDRNVVHRHVHQPLLSHHMAAVDLCDLRPFLLFSLPAFIFILVCLLFMFSFAPFASDAP